MKNNYEAVIGLEVHTQLLTKSKVFCGCSTKFGAPPNTNVCPICLGHPGVLPVLNEKVVEFTALMGLATECRINRKSILARKNYFYPDLPKGYQISQFEIPVCEDGYLRIEEENGSSKKIRIKRIHLEEDAGKSIHDQDEETLVDLNRCGVPLMEIVSEPDLSSSKEASQYLMKLRQIVTYLGICDGNMEEGSLRCDANISVREKGNAVLGVKTEIKNMNSFRNVERAIEFEINRQIDLLEEGETVTQETLLWNADQNRAHSMRSKEESHDYRYFPDPDLTPVFIDETWKEEIRSSMPELPEARKKRFMQDYNLPEYDAGVLTSQKENADYFEESLSETDDYKSASNWVMGEVMKVLNEEKFSISEFNISAKNLGKLIELINKNVISGKIAKDVFTEMLKTNENPEKIVKEKNLVQITDQSEIENIIKEILEKHPAQVKDYLGGKEKALGFFVGQVMRKTKGKANPQLVNSILKNKLEELRNS